MADFLDEINRLMTEPQSGRAPAATPKSFSDEINAMLAAPPPPPPGADGRTGTAYWGHNPIGWSAELGRWVYNNPGEAAEFGTQLVTSGLGALAGAPGGPPGMAMGAAAGNVLGRQAARGVRRLAGATPEEAPMLDPAEMTVDLATGAAGQVVRPLARGFTGARLNRGALELPMGDPSRGLAGAIEDTATSAAHNAARTLRRVGEIGGIGSAIGGQPALGVALYLGSHAAEPVHRRAAEALLKSQGFRNWIGEFPGQPPNWREALTALGAMSADQFARHGMGADVRDAVRMLGDTIEGTVMPPASAGPPTLGGPRPARSPFAVVTTPSGDRGRDLLTGQFVPLTAGVQE